MSPILTVVPAEKKLGPGIEIPARFLFQYPMKNHSDNGETTCDIA